MSVVFNTDLLQMPAVTIMSSLELSAAPTTCLLQLLAVNTTGILQLSADNNRSVLQLSAAGIQSLQQTLQLLLRYGSTKYARVYYGVLVKPSASVSLGITSNIHLLKCIYIKSALNVCGENKTSIHMSAVYETYYVQ